MAHSILLPVDGSDHSIKAINVACDLAARHDSQIIVLFVVQSHEVPESLKRWASAEHIAEPASWLLGSGIADNVIASATDRIKGHGIKSVESVVDQGSPADSIIAVAKNHAVDMVVMGTRGHNDWQGLVLGSVAHKVSHAAPCTVITVR